MNVNTPARAAGLLLIAVAVASSGLVEATEPPRNDQIPEMVATIFAGVEQTDHMSVVFKDAPRRQYLAFYLSTYGDTRELRAYRVTFRNVRAYLDDFDTIDTLLDEGNHAEAFDGLLGMMRLDLGSQYVSDVDLDGVHEGDVPVGSGHLRDRFHQQVFGSYAEANSAYLEWLSQAVELANAVT